MLCWYLNGYFLFIPKFTTCNDLSVLSFYPPRLADATRKKRPFFFSFFTQQLNCFEIELNWNVTTDFFYTSICSGDKATLYAFNCAILPLKNCPSPSLTPSLALSCVPSWNPVPILSLATSSPSTNNLASPVKWLYDAPTNVHLSVGVELELWRDFVNYSGIAPS